MLNLVLLIGCPILMAQIAYYVIEDHLIDRRMRRPHQSKAIYGLITHDL